MRFGLFALVTRTALDITVVAFGRGCSRDTHGLVIERGPQLILETDHRLPSSAIAIRQVDEFQEFIRKLVAGGIHPIPPSPSRLFTPSYGNEKPPSVRRLLHTGEVQGSIPCAPTKKSTISICYNPVSHCLCPEVCWTQRGHRKKHRAQKKM